MRGCVTPALFSRLPHFRICLCAAPPLVTDIDIYTSADWDLIRDYLDTLFPDATSQYKYCIEAQMHYLKAAGLSTEVYSIMKSNDDLARDILGKLGRWVFDLMHRDVFADVSWMVLSFDACSAGPYWKWLNGKLKHAHSEPPSSGAVEAAPTIPPRVRKETGDLSTQYCPAWRCVAEVNPWAHGNVTYDKQMNNREVTFLKWFFAVGRCPYCS